MKFRYLICSIYDDPPKGTNNEAHAKMIAGLAQDWYVVDVLEGRFLPPAGENLELEEDDPSDWV
jgi:hypothetical protein